MKTLVVTIVSLLLVSMGLGCAALSYYVTPAEVNKKAVVYVTSAGVAEPNDYAGYENLAKAERLRRDVDIAHSTNQFNLQQLMDEDNFEHAVHSDVTNVNSTAGKEREKMIFGERGLLPLGLSMIGFGSLTGFVGLMRKRPGDVTQVEMEQTVAQATGKTVEELSAKQKCLIEIVKGVQTFMNTFKSSDPTVVTTMKDIFDKTQDTATRITIAEIKKTL